MRISDWSSDVCSSDLGSIQLGADPVSAGASTTNLRRLVALQLQSAFPEPEFVRIDAKGFGQNDQWGEKAEVCRSNASLCIACGKAHENTDVTKGRTERGNAKWFYRCADGGSASMRTPCFGCGSVAGAVGKGWVSKCK